MAKFCSTCKYRDEGGNCNNDKIREDWSLDSRQLKDDPECDMLIYSYDENGSFWVGPKFGCVHWRAKPKTKKVVVHAVKTF